MLDAGALPRGEYGLPGQLRHRLVSAVLDGSTTATTSLVDAYRREEPASDESLDDEDGNPAQ